MSAGAQVGFAPPAPRRPVAAARKGMRVFLGIDLGVHMGWAVVDEDGRRVGSGVWHFTQSAKESQRDPGARWLRAHAKVREFLGRYATHSNYRLGSVGYELVRRHEGVKAAHVYGALESILQAQCSALEICPDTVEVADLKQIAVGAGGGRRADKEAVMRAALARWPEMGGDDNEADALWLADMERRRVLGVAL